MSSDNRPTGNTPLHICHAVLSMDVGGLEHIVLSLARMGQEIGNQVSILCIEKPGELARSAEAIGAKVLCAHKPAGFRPKLSSHIARLFRKLRPDVVHTHQIGALLYAGPAARRAGVPLVVHTEHGKHYAGQWRRRLVGRVAGRYARRFFAVSADILREVREQRIAPRAKTALVPNGIDVHRFASESNSPQARRAVGIPAGAYVVGTVGRLAAVKRQDILLRGFARLATRLSHAHLLLVGDGPRRAELANLAADLGIANRVTFAGYTDRPEQLLALMDLFALTSESEGMPLAILEAWAASKPVVASRVGGVPELIVDGLTGLLFEAGDDAHLAQQLQQLEGNAPLARALGRAGHCLVRNRFDTRAMANAYEGHYRELLEASVAFEGACR